MSNTVAYSPGSNSIIDFVPDGTTEVPERLHKYGTDLIILSAPEAFKRYEDGFRSPVIEITAEQWDEALGCLPPVAWRHDGGGESFHISELVAGNIANIYVRIGERYFTFADSRFLKGAERVERAKAFMAVPCAP